LHFPTGSNIYVCLAVRTVATYTIQTDDNMHVLAVHRHICWRLNICSPHVPN